MTLFQTKHFIIREFNEEDSFDCEEFLADKDVMKFIGDGRFNFSKTSSLDMVRWFLESCNNETGLGTWAIQLIENDKVVGNCHLSKNSELNEIEFGLAFSKKIWGKGYGTEVSRGLIKYGHIQLGIKKIIGTVQHDNYASKGILEKLGYNFSENIELYGMEQELYLKSK